MTPTPPRMTTTTVQVLEVLTQDHDAERYGLEIMAMTGLPSGTVFPILARFEAIGWLQSGWEEVDARAAGRPRRRYYRFTDDGLAATSEALQRVHRQRRQRAAVLRPVQGLA